MRSAREKRAMSKLAVIVDDNRALAEGLGEILEAEGYQIRIFDDPLDALRETSNLAFDVALLDVRMPGMDGVTLQQQLMTTHPDARFVLMTAYADDQRISQGLSAGASAVLPKPVPIAELFDALGDQGARDLLLVEDDAAFREALSEVLSQDGYRCHGAASAREARQVIAASSAQGCTLAMAVIDVRLPDGSGAQLARELEAANLSCVLMTGWDPDEPKQQLQGRLHVLVKPFSPDRLLKVLSELRGARP
jgi:DNA-binding response OmpR family regulator